VLAPEERRRLLKALQEDEEFRLAVAGALGLEEVLRAIRSLQEQVAGHTEVIKSLQEQVIKQGEAIKSLQEQVTRHSEAIKSLQEQVVKQGEAIAALQKSVERLSGAVEKLSGAVAGLGRKYGVFTEEAFRDAVRYLVEDLLRVYETKRWVYYDSEGAVFGRPSVVEVDVLVRDGEHILVEYKASIDRSDVAELAREGALYERVAGTRPRLLIVGPVATKRAVELARSLGVEVRAGEVVE
jgi:hypothetical protein